MAFKDKLKDAKEKAAGLGEKAAGMGGLAAGKLNELLEDYRAAVETLETLGFEVTRFRVSMGVLPEINTSVRGSLKGVKEDEIRELVAKNEGKKILDPDAIERLRVELLRAAEVREGDGAG